MPQITFEIATAADDGRCSYSGATWPPATTFEEESPGNYLYSRSQESAGTYTKTCNFLRWDTSALSSYVVTGATLRLYSVSTGDPSGVITVVGDYYDFGGTPAVAGDYVSTVGTSIFTPKLITSFGAGFNTLPLLDISGININGYTGIRITNSDATTPGAGQLSSVLIGSYDIDTSQSAELIVEYGELPTSAYAPPPMRVF